MGLAMDQKKLVVEPKLVQPDRWSEKYDPRLDVLHTSLWLKKAYELKLKTGMKTDIGGEDGSEPADSDDEKVFAFRKLLTAEWPGGFRGPVELITMILAICPSPITEHPRVPTPAACYSCIPSTFKDCTGA